MVQQLVFGDRTDGLLERVDSILSTKAQAAVAMIGFNDIHQGIALDQVFDNDQQFVETLTTHGRQVWVQSTLLAGRHYRGLNPSLRDLNERIQSTCEGHPLASFFDLNSAMTVDGQLNPEYSRDWVHRNGDRYRVWHGAIENRVTLLHSPRPLTLFD